MNGEEERVDTAATCDLMKVISGRRKVIGKG